MSHLVGAGPGGDCEAIGQGAERPPKPDPCDGQADQLACHRGSHQRHESDRGETNWPPQEEGQPDGGGDDNGSGSDGRDEGTGSWQRAGRTPRVAGLPAELHGRLVGGERSPPIPEGLGH